MAHFSAYKHQTSIIALIIISTLAMLLIATVACAEDIAKGKSVAPFTPLIKPGEYVWLPEMSPSGPVVIVANLPEQIMYVYRNGVRIGRSTFSSGKAENLRLLESLLSFRIVLNTSQTSIRAQQCPTWNA